MKIKRLIPYAIGVVIGAAGGYLYWKFVGCSSGSCSITSVWYNSTAYGAIMGGLIVNTFSGIWEKKKSGSQEK